MSIRRVKEFVAKFLFYDSMACTHRAFIRRRVFDLGFYLAIRYAKGERLASLFARLVTVGFKIAPHLLNHPGINYSDFGSPRTPL